MAQPGGNLGFNPFQQTATQLAQNAVTQGASQGAITGVRPSTLSSTWDDNSMLPGHAPQTAAAAPSNASNALFIGLCGALNEHQRSLVHPGGYDIADQYEIVFSPPSLATATVTPPGPVVYSNTPTQNPNTASAKLDPSTDALNTTAQIWQVLPGTQIVQFIDQVMRGSSFIRDQQIAQIDADNKQTTPSTTSGKITSWYKISVQATDLGYDKQRRDHAYKMTFVISTYAVNQMNSQYFVNPKYRGAHKAYNYWFTGLNTQVLDYEQEYNYAYYQTITNTAETLVRQPPPTGPDQISNTFMATSEVRGQGQPGYVNNPADSAAAFLYGVSDFGWVTLKIAGDPAWLQQGEVAVGINPNTFNFNPFNADGGINFDSQQVVFTLSFNQPTDYDFNTGIMNVNATNGAPKKTFAYMARSCKNMFKKGQFTQELVGTLLPLATEATSTAAANGRAAAPPAPTAAGSRDTTNSVVSAADEANPDLWNDGTATQSTGARTEDEFNADNPPTPQPASPPGEPTSNGDVQQLSFGSLGNNIASAFTNFNNRLTGLNTPPQVIAKDDS